MDLKTQKQTKRIEIHQSEIANGQGQICLRKAKLWKWEGRDRSMKTFSEAAYFQENSKTYL